MYHVEASAGRSQAPDVTVFQSALAGDRGLALSAPSGAQLWVQNKYSCYERQPHPWLLEPAPGSPGQPQED